MSESSDNTDAAAFYDDFLDRRMVNYRLHGNPRLDEATEFLIPHLRPDSRVLEVGCGIGIVTEALARRARRGHVWATDLSAKNIAYAERTVRPRNISWSTIDLLADPHALRAWVPDPVNVVVMVDVFEHIPKGCRRQLMESINLVAASDFSLLLTFPSAEYQGHLYRELPEELQPVDETVSATDLESLGVDFDLRLVYWQTKDVWLTDQYVHAVLQRKSPLEPVGTPVRRLPRRIVRRLLSPYRRHRYGLPAQTRSD